MTEVGSWINAPVMSVAVNRKSRLPVMSFYYDQIIIFDCFHSLILKNWHSKL